MIREMAKHGCLGCFSLAGYVGALSGPTVDEYVNVALSLLGCVVAQQPQFVTCFGRAD